MEDLILAIDQGTSSTKALLMNAKAEVVRQAQAPLETTYFPDGRVEQDPYAILKSVEMAVLTCLEGIQPSQIKSIGISNQRETFVLWDETGKPVFPAVVWACKRSTKICEDVKEQQDWIQEKTGLVIDPYFSGTKLLWILQHNPEIKRSMDQGKIYFGTIDTWILYHLTNRQSYYCDITNASRTLLFNLTTLTWDQEIIQHWGLEKLHLPGLKHSSDHFGFSDLFGWSNTPIPIGAMIGDSHASMFGETCFQEGDTKMTLGTGCSMLMNIGNQPRKSNNGLLSTIAWSHQGQVVFAWEGAIVACGSMMDWLKNTLHIVDNVGKSAEMAYAVQMDSDVYLIPAFSGLGAPFWQMDRKASWHGLTFGTGPEHLVKATLDSIVFQIKAVVDAMEADLGKPIQQISMHGGLSQNTYVQECLSSLIKAKIQIQDNHHISAQGAAFLAGLQVGIFSDMDQLKRLIRTQPLSPILNQSRISMNYQTWKDIIQTKTLS